MKTLSLCAAAAALLALPTIAQTNAKLLASRDKFPGAVAPPVFSSRGVCAVMVRRDGKETVELHDLKASRLLATLEGLHAPLTFQRDGAFLLGGTIRGLGLSISVLNLYGGMQAIVVPLIVLERLRLPEPVVGLLFALSGLTGMASADTPSSATRTGQGAPAAAKGRGRGRANRRST